MGPLLENGDRTVKLAVVDALLQVATPTRLAVAREGVDDADRDVRIAAVKFLASRGHRNALARVEAALTSPQLKAADLTEKMAFYEAYGTLAGAKGVGGARQSAGGQGGVRAEGRPGDARLRRDGAGQDPHAGGTRQLWTPPCRTRSRW